MCAKVAITFQHDLLYDWPQILSKHEKYSKFNAIKYQLKNVCKKVAITFESLFFITRNLFPTLDLQP